MTQQLIIQVEEELQQVAITQNGRLVEYYLERQQQDPQTGHIYRGKIETVLPGMQAAFVDIGWEKNAYLPLDEVLQEQELAGCNPNIQDLLRPGQEIIVQVRKEAAGNKGPKVSCRLNLLGHYLILLPGGQSVAISRKIEPEEKRQQLKSLLQNILRQSSGAGIIVRTAAEGASEEELQQELKALQLRWAALQQQIASKGGIALLTGGEGLGLQFARDTVRPDGVMEVVTNHAALAQQLKQLFPVLQKEGRIKLRESETLLMDYGLQQEIESCCRRRVWLKNGGYLVLDKTEALNVIDVNTGKFTGGKDVEETIVQMNLEAAVEISRQIRLRNLSGIILIDFIDMGEEGHRQAVLEAFTAACRQDRIKTKIEGWTGTGLLEMTRQRVKAPLHELLEKTCTCCRGKGSVFSEVTVGLRLKQELAQLCRRTEASSIAVHCHPLVAAYLIGENGRQLEQLSKKMGKTLWIHGVETLAGDGYQLQAVHQLSNDQENGRIPVEPHEIVKVTITDRHHEKKRDGVARVQGYVLNIINGGDRVGDEVLVECMRIFATNAVCRIL